MESNYFLNFLSLFSNLHRPNGFVKLKSEDLLLYIIVLRLKCVIRFKKKKKEQQKTAKLTTWRKNIIVNFRNSFLLPYGVYSLGHNCEDTG